MKAGLKALLFALILLASLGIILISTEDRPDPDEGIIKAQNNSSVTEIARIILQPLDYSNKEVLINGTVEEAIVVSGKAYVKVFDGTGRIIVSFPSDREFIISRGLIFMTDPQIKGKTILVNGTVRLNVPLGRGEDHGAFAYLVDVNTIELVS